MVPAETPDLPTVVLPPAPAGRQTRAAAVPAAAAAAQPTRVVDPEALAWFSSATPATTPASREARSVSGTGALAGTTLQQFTSGSEVSRSTSTRGYRNAHQRDLRHGQLHLWHRGRPWHADTRRGQHLHWQHDACRCHARGWQRRLGRFAWHRHRLGQLGCDARLQPKRRLRGVQCHFGHRLARAAGERCPRSWPPTTPSPARRRSHRARSRLAMAAPPDRWAPPAWSTTRAWWSIAPAASRSAGRSPAQARSPRPAAARPSSPAATRMPAPRRSRPARSKSAAAARPARSAPAASQTMPPSPSTAATTRS